MRPWKKLQSTPVVADRWLHLTADRCELPDGHVLDPYYVVHDPEWAHVFALDAHDRLLLVRQFRYAAGATCLELPGGVVDAGETPLDAARRELREETGHTATDWAFVGCMYANPARQTNRVHLYIARNATRSHAPQLELSEEIEVSLQPVEAVQAAIESGEFSQALHIASYYRCLRQLDRERGA